MTGKLDWRKSRLGVRPSMSLADEAEWRSRDAAARWLDKQASGKAKPKRRGNRGQK